MKIIAHLLPSILFVTCISLSCNMPSMKQEKMVTETAKSTDLSFSPVDTLNKYGLDEDTVRIIIDSPLTFVYINTVNGYRAGVICFADSISIACKQLKNGWMETSRTDATDDFGWIQFVDEVDLNGDGYKDLRFTWMVMRGNEACQVFLFDTSAKSFKRNHYYDLMNIGYDTRTGMMRSCAMGSNFDNSKDLYLITGDSLTFFKAIHESLDWDHQYSGSSLSIYENRKDKRTLVKTIKGPASEIANRFDTMLWEGDMDYYYQTKQ